MTRQIIFDAVKAARNKPWTPTDIAVLDAALDRLGVGKAEGSDGAHGAPTGSSGANSTYDRAAMIAELRRDEGERLKAYKDSVGKWTIGIGRNLDDVGISAAETQALGITTASARSNGITKEQSAALLESDLGRVDADLDRVQPWWRKLDPVRQRVMVNMAFNMGIGRKPDPARGIKGTGLSGFVNTLRMIEAGRYDAAASNMLASKWASQVGARAQRLSAMMRTGRA